MGNPENCAMAFDLKSVTLMGPKLLESDCVFSSSPFVQLSTINTEQGAIVASCCAIPRLQSLTPSEKCQHLADKRHL
jgi:hypothetical protein